MVAKGSGKFADIQSLRQHVIQQCDVLGYTQINQSEQKKIDYFEITRNDEKISVQIKNHSAKTNIAEVCKFTEYLDLDQCLHLSAGWLISTSGFSKPALTHIRTERPSNLRLGTSTPYGIRWDYDPLGEEELEADEIFGLSNAEAQQPPTYIGVFTCKGGVGKTTVAAHLAGAFALQGYDVILVDLDPDKNLRKLFIEDQTSDDETASLYVPAHRKGFTGSTITVLNAEEWDERQYPDVKIVICDCSPVLSENPSRFIRRFDHCLIPTTLSPLGIAKNGDVIIRTFRHIRSINNTAALHSLINCYIDDGAFVKRNRTLLSALENYIRDYQKEDSNCQLIDPKDARIRRNDNLLYWGYHIVDGSMPRLAFNEVLGRSVPRTDFLQLAEYLETKTSIRQKHKPLAT